MLDAVSVAIDHAFNGRHAKSEYRDKSFSKEIEEQHMSEEQKIEETKKLFKNLELMQQNFERNNKNTSKSE